VCEPAILVRRKHRGSQVWSMEKFENKIIDMRDMFEERKAQGIPLRVDDSDESEGVCVHALHVLLYCQFVCHVKCDLVCGYINVRNGLNTNLALMHHSIAYHYKTLCPLLRSLLPYFFLLNIIIFIYFYLCYHDYEKRSKTYTKSFSLVLMLSCVLFM